MKFQPKQEKKKYKLQGHGGVGMPQAIYLEEFGWQLYCAFGEYPYQVGSSLFKKIGWRDVDVRIILDDKKYEEMGLGDPSQPQQNAKWTALTLAFTALGRQMTGLPIDFQIQQTTDANKLFDDPRSALGIQAYYRFKGEIK